MTEQPTTLRAVLRDPWRFEAHWGVACPKGSPPSLDSPAQVAKSDPDGFEGILLMEQVQDIVEGHAEQLGRQLTDDEAFRAVMFYWEHDAYIEPEELLGKPTGNHR